MHPPWHTWRWPLRMLPRCTRRRRRVLNSKHRRSTPRRRRRCRLGRFSCVWTTARLAALSPCRASAGTLVAQRRLGVCVCVRECVCARVCVLRQPQSPGSVPAVCCCNQHAVVVVRCLCRAAQSPSLPQLQPCVNSARMDSSRSTPFTRPLRNTTALHLRACG